MGNLKPLVIGELVVPKPVIQGGMGVGISLSSLAGAVEQAAWESFLPHRSVLREPDFADHPLEANLERSKKEFKKAREKSRKV